MKMFSFSNKTLKEASLVLDIGSKSVSGGIFEKDAKGNIKLLYTATEPIDFQKVLTGEKLQMAMLRSLELVLIHLEKYGLEHINRLSKSVYHVNLISGVISSPWHVSETKNLALVKSEPFVMAEDLIGELINKEEKKFIEQFPLGKNEQLELAVLERKIIEIKLNGYPTAQPYGKKATELELRVFTSIASKHISDRITSSISKYFSSQHLEFHTFSLVAFASIRDLFPNVENFLIVQVGGEITDITIAKKGVIAETVCFPLGHNSLLRALDKICGSHPKCTLDALLKLHFESQTNTTDRKKVENSIADAKSSWLELFNNSVSNFSVETFLPKNVFLFEDNSYSSLFGEFLKSVDSRRYTATDELFDIKTCNEFGVVFSSLNQSISSDVILAMEANFMSRFGNHF